MGTQGLSHRVKSARQRLFEVWSLGLIVGTSCRVLSFSNTHSVPTVLVPVTGSPKDLVRAVVAGRGLL